MSQVDRESGAIRVWLMLAGIFSLAVALALVAAISSQVVVEQRGPAGVWAAWIAAGVCWLSASLALAITAQSTGGPQAITGILFAMLVRMAGPLAFGVAITAMGGPLARAGLFGLIVVHYLVALVIETGFAVRLVSHEKASKALS